MERVSHSDLLRFRAPPLLRDQVERAAAKRGMNLSEFLRSAVREKIGLA